MSGLSLAVDRLGEGEVLFARHAARPYRAIAQYCMLKVLVIVEKDLLGEWRVKDVLVGIEILRHWCSIKLLLVQQRHFGWAHGRV